MSEREVRYRTTVDGLDPAAVTGGFFEGWTTPLDPAEHLAVLRGSSHVVLALAGDSVVGFVNALSDGVLTAYIPLLEVLPTHRGRGVGRELVQRLLAEIGPLYMIDVMCDDEVFAFYEPLGFQRAGGGIIRHHDWRERAT